MPGTGVSSQDIQDGNIWRADLHTATTGKAVVRKVTTGTGLSSTYDGADPGTGDVVISLSGSITGGNYISNPDAETDTTGWSASGANFTVARTTTTGEVLKGSGSFEFTGNGSQAVNDYVSSSFTLDLGDRNRLLKLGFYFKGTSNYDAGDMVVVLHDGTNEIIPSITSIPGGSGYFEATWISTSASTYTLRFKAKVTSAFSLSVDNVHVGRKEIVKGAAIGPWESFTPTFSGLGTVTNIAMFKRRVGSNLEIKGRFTTGTVTASVPTMTIGGVNIDTTIASAFKTGFGAITRLTSGSTSVYDGSYTINATYDGTNTDRVQFVINSLSGSYQSVNATAALGNNEESDVVFLSIPIDGWSSDTVLTNSAVEYAHNSDTSNADDTTNFAYSVNGGVVPSVSTSMKKKRVRFRTPIQASDLVVLQFLDANTGGWVNAGDSRFGLIRRGDTATGLTGSTLLPVNATDFDVCFVDQGCLSTSITDTTSSWSSEASAGTRWRVIKCANPLAVESSDKVVQVVYEEITSSGTFSNAWIPFDDTIPQNTEGAELLTATIVPRYANSDLIVEAQVFAGEETNNSNGIAAALFRDSTADAFAVTALAYDSANSPFAASISFAPLRVTRKVAANATTATTFKLRIGIDAINTIRYNGLNGSRQFGGALVSYLKITEVRV